MSVCQICGKVPNFEMYCDHCVAVREGRVDQPVPAKRDAEWRKRVAAASAAMGDPEPIAALATRPTKCIWCDRPAIASIPLGGVCSKHFELHPVSDD